MRRFLLDNDSSNITSALDDQPERTVEETVRECPASVSTYLLCSGAGTCYYPTKVGHVNPRNTMLLEAHRRGLDPFGMLLRGLREADKETFITCRMNDVHNPTDADQWNTPRLRREHPDCIVGQDEVAAGKAGWMSYCMDYGRSEVRGYMLELIREQVELYGEVIDGLQLDWMRFPRHLAGPPEQAWAQRQVITDFTVQVRALLRDRKRPLLLAARVPATPQGCHSLGFDLAEWGRRGLVDMLVACPFLTTQWYIPVPEFRGLLENAAIPVYAGFDFGFGTQCHFPESLRGISTSLYACGADGIYLFNFPCWTEYLASRPYHWLEGLDQPETAAAKPLLLAVEHNRHRTFPADALGQLPAAAPASGALELSLFVPQPALPARRGMVLVHSHGEVALEVGGRPAPPRRFGEEPTGAHRSEIFLEFVDQYWQKDSRPRPEDCRVFAVEPTCLRAGQNALRLTNLSGHDLEIDRVNLALW